MVDEWDEVARRRSEAASRLTPEARALQLELLRLAGNVGGRRVLELGCRTGALARRLAERGARVLAVDPSPDAIDLALADAREVEPQGPLEFGVADPAERGTLPQGPFDLVVVHDPEAGPALRNGALAVRRGGRLLLATERPESLAGLFGRLREAGLRTIDLAESGTSLVLLTERARPRRRSRSARRAR